MLRASLTVLLVPLIAASGMTPSPATASAAPRTPASATAAENDPTAIEGETVAGASVLINELANGGARSDYDTFVELRNWGARAVDLTGWQIYRCSAQGLRANIGRAEAELTGVTLAPGEVYTISRPGMPGDAAVTQPLASSGFGMLLLAPDGAVADAVGVYPNEPWPTRSECSGDRNLPNSLSFAHNESWQRVAVTGSTVDDWVRATATLGEPNATAAPARAESSVVVSELAGVGPASSSDEFVELHNAGDRAEEIGGWRLSRCTASGRLRENTLQLVVPAGTVLAPGQRWVAAAADFTGTAQAYYPTPMADTDFGVRLDTAEGRLVDRVAVSGYADSACQEGDAKLPAVADRVLGESYQRTDDGDFVIAPRTPGRANAATQRALVDEPFAYPEAPAVAISELATDPSPEGMPAGTVQRNYAEIGNYGQESVDIGGWTLRRCQADGLRAREVQATVPRGTVLAPGEVWLIAREGTAAAVVADQSFQVSFALRGTGLWLADAEGTRVDSMGVYARNEMDRSIIMPSLCSKGLALSTALPDRLEQQTFQRTAFTGVDTDDFVVAAATPGVIDRVPWVDPTGRVDTRGTTAASDPAPPEAPEASEMSEAREASGAEEDELAPAGEAEVPPAVIREAWAGSSPVAPPPGRVGGNEVRLDPNAAGPVLAEGYEYPYQRFVLDARELEVGGQLAWSGSTRAGNEVQLWIWNAGRAGWRLLDAGTGAGGDTGKETGTGTEGTITLQGPLLDGDLIDGEATLLVQDGPRTEQRLVEEVDGQLQDPENYDLAVAHVTDTQYLSESYPAVYAQVLSWIADEAEPRGIAFVTHTGDLIQNWVDPNQAEDRARFEFERASRIQSILDEAGVPNSVLPGNHDNLRGVSDALFNEYFGPERYRDAEGYGGSIAPDDNSANFSTFEREGAAFLMLSLPYAYGEREIAWAEEVVAAHPGHNVVISTHEHVTPKTEFEPARRSVASRWVSQADQLWRRVIAPNRNVVLVLSGHFHGLGRIVTENAGGIEGHTVVEVLADYQEFRTHTGERATGFFRMLQFDLDAGRLAVDTRSVRLDEGRSADYDYRQFILDNGSPLSPGNEQPWRIVAEGLQGRYEARDEEFVLELALQQERGFVTNGVGLPPSPEEAERESGALDGATGVEPFQDLLGRS